jgi:glycosyltransferase involved in cell wall biosynthesis
MRIVLDLGTSWLWNRPPVGIVRTEQRFARFLLETSECDVAFCRFDKGLGHHVALTAEQARELVAPAAASGQDDPEPKVAEPVRPAAAFPPRVPLGERVAEAIKRGGHEFVRRLPEPLRPDALETLRSGYRLARGATRLGANWWRGRRDRRPPAQGPLAVLPAVAPASAFAFDPSDVYVSMGLDWEHNSIPAVHSARRRVGFRTILFCYDIIPVMFPHLMSFDARQSFARYFVDVAHTADRVIAISETSRTDFLALMRETQAPQPPVDVVLLGTELDAVEGSMRSPFGEVDASPFVLCVSTIEARKNHQVLYNVWDRLVERHGDSVPTLVIVGMVGWGVGDLMFRMHTNPRTKNKIRILDNLPDEELAWLYRHALFTVFPSLYEGWGLPVVESLSLGTPCICSTAAAVAEAAQGLATVVDPLDTPGWVNAIEAMWRDEDLRARAAARCAREFRPARWNDHARELSRIARLGANT